MRVRRLVAWAVRRRRLAVLVVVVVVVHRRLAVLVPVLVVHRRLAVPVVVVHRRLAVLVLVVVVRRRLAVLAAARRLRATRCVDRDSMPALVELRRLAVVAVLCLLVAGGEIDVRCVVS